MSVWVSACWRQLQSLLLSNMPTELVASWGNTVRATQHVYRLKDRHSNFPVDLAPESFLPFGNGRSYGDSCLNVGGGLLHTGALDRFIEFDSNRGILVCESGAQLDDILSLIVSRGWFIPVTPGTRFITVGGAIANDVHGKNHHGAGTFSRHVKRFELLRSDGSRIRCAPDENSDWYRATVGGLGLTGLITWVELQLRSISSSAMAVESIRFRNLDEFMQLCVESDKTFEYTVAWVDTSARGSGLGRGIFQRANHSTEPLAKSTRKRALSMPVTPPLSLVNGVSTRLFNIVHYHGQSFRATLALEPYEAFFYPLDGILHWNRMYGPRGMHQYQCVIPASDGKEATAALLDTIARSGLGSFLAVLKQFGNLESDGLLSFPREGLTLAVDFPNRGARLERLFRELDAIVAQAGGRLYPAKDGRMSGDLFRSGYPNLSRFSQYVDPRCSSSFWRRVMEGA
jgi:FAD/FMN-containing dehydrogenase